MGGEDDIHRRLLRGPHERPCGHRTASSHCPPQGSGPRRRLATTLITAGNAAGENRAWWSILRSSNSEPPMSLEGLPGRARLSTKPAATGSVTFENTIGTIWIAACNTRR